MKTYDFIFSNYFQHRIARHAVFWFVWFATLVLTINIPTFMFVDWNIKDYWWIVVQRGGVLNSMEYALNLWWKALIPQMIFVYTIIYYLLPKFFLRKRNWIIVTGITILIFVSVFIAAYYVNWLSFYQTYSRGWRTKMPDSFHIMVSASRNAVLVYPIVAGFAVVIKLLKRWWLKEKETEQLIREKAMAEIQLLKAQIHPHFLFNTLNNIYYFTLTNSNKAPGMVKKLSGMLHYILNECNQPKVPLEKELKMIQDYMALEKIRYGDILKMSIKIKGNYSNKTIAPLLLIPFVENSFKHGTSKMLEHPWVKLHISIEEDALYFYMANNLPDEEHAASLQHRGIGLGNVKKRLQLIYPVAHDLNIIKDSLQYEVFLKIGLLVQQTAGFKPDAKTQFLDHELV